MQLELGLIMGHSIVLIFTPFMFLVCGFWFVFFKLQVSKPPLPKSSS
jgi:hypothetical protein